MDNDKMESEYQAGAHDTVFGTQALGTKQVIWLEDHCFGTLQNF